MDYPAEYEWHVGCGQRRCAEMKFKIHAGDSVRAQKPSSWRCALVTGHPHGGRHWAKPSAHQASWVDDPARTGRRARRAG